MAENQHVTCPNCKGSKYSVIMETHPSGGRKGGPGRLCGDCGYNWTVGYDDAACTWYLHPETERLVDEFAQALKRRLLLAQLEGTFIHQWMNPEWRDQALERLKKNIAADQPLDVAAYAAFFWRHGWSMKATEVPPSGQ